MERSWARTEEPRRRGGDGREGGGTGDPRAGEPPPIALHWHGEADPDADRAWLVKNLVYERGRGLTAGQWGTGKTFAALDLSASVMTGERFAGRKVMRTGGVLFIAPEGAFEIPVRLRGLVEGKLRGVAAQRAAAGVPPPDLDALPFAWIEECPPLARRGAVHRLIAAAHASADAMHERFGVELVLVILDTVAAGAGFEDENSAAETQRVMDAMGELSRATGAFVMGVDHFGKLVETGTRGSSAKEVGADVVLALLATRTEAGEVSNTRMAVRKVRGAPAGYEIPFELQVVPVGEDGDGEPVTTCVVQWKLGAGAEPRPAAVRERWPQSLRIFRTALSVALVEHGALVRPFGAGGPEVRAVKETALRWEFLRAYPAGGEDEAKRTEAKRKAFARALRTALDKGLVAAREIGGVDHLWTVGEPDGRDA
ncbi:AAA family ATPase [Methylobacterium terricola]|uniref:AAA family ATPase n=1 Tax=Methylobacterium terricola TaxID=2583531 RepID=A0A5C4L5V6_9HYPH|nr:AAA family ATPase [Methylobacterium terricola]